MAHDDPRGAAEARLAEALREKAELEARLREVTERAAEFESRLRTALEVSRDGFWVLDRTGRILDVNEASCERYGYTRDELLRMSIPDLEADQSPEEVRANIALVYGRGGAHFETRHRRKDGGVIDVDISAARHGDRLVSFTRDISEKKRVEEALRRTGEELRALTDRLQHVREEEKARIARDLHDDLGQALTGLQYEMRWLEDRVDELLPAARKAEVLDRLVSASGLAASMLATVQRITRELRPAVLDRHGLPAALREELNAFGQRTGIAVRSDVEVTRPLPHDLALALYRICQEALTNVARHSGARRVEVALAVRSGAVMLTVSDDGVGLTPPPSGGRTPLGILGMVERARALGGEVAVLGRAAGGTQVIATVPLPAEEAGG